MKKRGVPMLLLVTVAFVFFTVGFFFGKNQLTDPVIVSIPASMQTEPTQPVEYSKPEETEPAVVFPINLNTADLRELTALPGIGEVLAQRILNYRSEKGNFSSVEELLNVEGIGKKRFEDIWDLITIGG